MRAAGWVGRGARRSGSCWRRRGPSTPEPPAAAPPAAVTVRADECIGATREAEGGLRSSCGSARPAPVPPTRPCGPARRRASSTTPLLYGFVIGRLHSRRRCGTGKSVQVRHDPRHCDQEARTPHRHWAHRPGKAGVRAVDLGVRRPPASSCSPVPREMEGLCRPITHALGAGMPPLSAVTARPRVWRSTFDCLLSRGMTRPLTTEEQ